MTFRNKIYVAIFAILEFIAVLFFLGFVATKVAEASNNDTEQKIVTGSDQHEIKLVSLDPWVVEGQVLGMVAMYVYADATTKRPADYWEIYDKEGDLLAAGWFDRFGIRRTAVDRGIMEKEDKLEGIFVIVLDGDSI